MSIHPEYAQAILRGEKQVEFRKQRLAEDVSHVVVYATAPVSAVIGAFTVHSQETTAPSTLWAKFEPVAGISHEAFFSYFSDRTHGTGIRVGSVLAPPNPLSLNDDLGLARPPQSYQYLAETEASQLLSGMVTS